ncbi:MAG: hypothetical protein QOH13_2444, partial [Thermoleophilaceae bacterium]|nr:hypothetical protein [Thermoleophilaceae bacterium]
MSEKRSRPTRGKTEDPAVARRDFGLRRLRRLTRAAVVIAVVEAGGFSVLAASAIPGAGKHPVDAVKVESARQGGTLRAQHPARKTHRRRYHRRHTAVAPAPAPAAVSAQPAPA